MGCGASHPAVDRAGHRTERGALKLKILYDSSRKQLLFRIKEGLGLLSMDLVGLSDPYCEVSLNDPSGKVMMPPLC